MEEKSLFFIAIVPPEKIYEKIKGHQKVMSERFDSHKSYYHIPHLTLVPPFHIDNNKEELLKEVVESVVFEPFSLEIDGFDHFKKHTIYARVNINRQLLQIHRSIFHKLHSANNLLDDKINYFQKFVPHITVGYRDLEPNFKPAWEYFQRVTLQESFRVRKIALLKHDGEKWAVV